MTETTAPTLQEVAQWADGYWDTLTEGQQNDLLDAARDIYERFPSSSQGHDRDTALFAALKWIRGELTLEGVGARRAATKAAARAAFVEAQQVGVMAVRNDQAAEVPTAAALCIDRMSLRKALGKRPDYSKRTASAE